MECPICLSEFEGESHVEICSNHCGFCESCLSMVFEHAIRNAMKKYNLEPDPSSSTTYEEITLCEVRCPSCFDLIPSKTIWEHTSPSLLGEVDAFFGEEFTVVDDDACQQAFSVWAPSISELEQKSSQFLRSVKAKTSASEAEVQAFLQACRRFGGGKLTAEAMITTLLDFLHQDRALASSLVVKGDKHGTRFPSLIRNPILRAKFLLNFLQHFRDVPCSHCGEQVCYRCWRAAHESEEIPPCRLEFFRECPCCGYGVERHRGSPERVCDACGSSFNWHDPHIDYGDEHYEEDYY